MGSARAAILLVASVALLALFAYLGGGLVYGKVLLDDAQSAYTTAVDDQKSLAGGFDAVKTTGAAEQPSEAAARQERANLAEVVAEIENAEAQVESDDQSLADVSASLDQDRWLTPLMRPSIDSAARRLSLERKVLADAKGIVGGYAQVGEFFLTMYDIAIDFYTIGSAAKARDVDATQLAISKVQADTAKAIAQDKAPGLPPEVDAMMHQLQNVDTDFANLFKAALARNRTAFDAANAAGWADIAKLHQSDLSRVSSSITAYYSPLVDAYHRDAARAAAA